MDQKKMVALERKEGTPDHPVPNTTKRGIVLAAFIGLLAGLGAYTFHYGEGLSYFSKDPSACVNCHIMRRQYDSWQKGSHHAWAACVDCHLPHDFAAKWMAKGENGFLHSKGFTFQDFHEPIFLRKRSQDVLQDNCVHCHGDVADAMLHAGGGAGESRCVHCHGGVGHGEYVGLGKYERPEAGAANRG